MELAGPHVSTALGGSAAGQIVTSAILGGTASHLVGGKFANGAVTAAMQWAFNDLGSRIAESLMPSSFEYSLSAEDSDFIYDVLIIRPPGKDGAVPITAQEFDRLLSIEMKKLKEIIDHFGDLKDISELRWAWIRGNRGDSEFFGQAGGKAFSIEGMPQGFPSSGVGGDINYIYQGILYGARGISLTEGQKTVQDWNHVNGSSERTPVRMLWMEVGYKRSSGGEGWR